LTSGDLDGTEVGTLLQKRVVITGATGYVGSRIARMLEADGWQVVRLSRSRGSQSPDLIPFRLGDELDPRTLTGCGALVHCAYDFRPASPAEIHRVNVVGSLRLLQAARRAAIGRVVFISSVSAFPGCRSVYGRAKLQTEDEMLSAGAWAIRPGLVWGEEPGGLFGTLKRTLRAASLIPYPAGPGLVQYLVHEADVAEAVCRCLDRPTTLGAGPVTVAHPRPWPLHELLTEIGRSHGRRLVLVPVPWRLAWLPLRVGDALSLPLPFHSDNLISFVYQNRNPTFDALARLGVTCRPLSLQTEALPSGSLS
jgi:nucleoside-diphosphate-sugar epimerase